MRYAIVINLDYATQPYLATHAVWEAIRKAMTAAGFRTEGRVFTIDQPPEQATALAHRVMDHLAERLERGGRGLYLYLKEFYGYSVGCTENLLVPPLEGIQVSEGPAALAS